MSAVTATSKALSEVEWISRVSQYFVLNTYAIAHAIKTGTTAVSEKISKLTYKYLLPAEETAAIEAQTGIAFNTATMEITSTPVLVSESFAISNLLSREKAIEHITRAGKNLGFSEEIVQQTIVRLESTEVGGCLRTFGTAIKEFEHLPGASEVIDKIFRHVARTNSYNRIKGTFYELHVGLKLQKEGHTILEFCKKVGDFEYDIITNTHLIECKNWYWPSVTTELLKNPRNLEKFVQQITRSC